MKSKLLISFLLLASLYLNAQILTIDKLDSTYSEARLLSVQGMWQEAYDIIFSELNILNKSPEKIENTRTDSLRCLYHIYCAQEARFFDWNKHLYHFEQANQIAVEANPPFGDKLRIWAFKALGQNFSYFKNDPIKAGLYLDTARTIINTTQDSLDDDQYFGVPMAYITRVLMSNNDIPRLIDSLKSIEVLIEKRDSVNPFYPMKLYYNYAWAYSIKGIDSKYYYYVDKAIDIARSFTSERELLELLTLAFNASSTATYLGDVKRGLRYLDEAEFTFKKMDTLANKHLRVKLNSRRAALLAKIGMKEEAFQYFDSTDQYVRDNFKWPHKIYESLFYEQYDAYSSLGLKNKAAEALDKFEKVWLKDNPSLPSLNFYFDKRFVDDVKADNYFNNQEFSKAIPLISRVQEKWRENEFAEVENYIANESRLGVCLAKLGKIEEAIQKTEYLHKKLFVDSLKQGMIVRLKAGKNYYRIYNELLGLGVISLSQMEAELDKLPDFLRELCLENYKEKLTEDDFNSIYNLIEQALESINDTQLIPDNTYLNLIEHVRAFTLWSEVNSNKYWYNSNFSEEVITHRETLIDKINALSTIMSSKNLFTGIDSVKQNLRLLEEELRNFESKYLGDSFNNMNEIFKPLTLNEVRNTIPERVLVVQYFLGKNKLYGMSLDKHQMKRLSIPANEVNELLVNLNSKLVNCEKLNELGSDLYDLLIGALGLDLENYDRLVIIPDGYLQELSFDILMMNGAYLLETHAISYHDNLKNCLASFDLYKSKSIESLVAISPSYNGKSDKLVDNTSAQKNEQFSMLVRSGLYDLPAAHEEASQIADLTQGLHLSGSSLSKSKILNIIKQSSVVHLAMHAIVDFQNIFNSRLLLNSEDDLESALSFGEVSKMSLNSDMIVLSACNTGKGQIYKGQGAKSIARGFLSAGVPAVIMSLWKIPDEPSSKIMIDFYKYLKQGVTKDEALRNAQLNWIKNEDISEKLKHPYYWAGFIASGDMSPLQFKSSVLFKVLYGVAGLIIFSLLFFLLITARSN